MPGGGFVFGYDVAGEVDGGAAGSVEFVDVVGLGDGDGVVGEWRGEARQTAVELEDDVHANAEVGGHEEGTAEGGAFGFDGGQLVVPAGGAGDYGDAGLKATENVFDGCGWSGELDGHVAAFEL